MNMNDAKTLYSTTFGILNDYTLLVAELEGIVTLLSYLSETLDTEYYKHFKNDPVAASLRAAVQHALRVTKDFNGLDEPTDKLIKQFHDYLTVAERTMQEGV